MMIRATFLLLGMTLLSGCVGPKPMNDYVLAREALNFARASEAQSLASGWLFKAEETFQKAESAWKLNENDLARKLFIKSRKYSERAENSARVKKFKSGAGPG